MKALIFDLDGTLLDTFPAIVAAFNAATAPILGHESTPDEVVARFGVPDIPLVLNALPPISEAEQHQVLTRYFEAYAGAHGGVAPFEGIESLLDTAEKLGLKLGIMTGKGRRALEITLEHVGWENRFASTLTGDDLTHQKPHPEGVLRVAEELGVAPDECAFVGDSPADIGAGHNAGMISIVAGWHSYYLEQIREMHPDVWPHTPAELEKWLRENH